MPIDLGTLSKKLKSFRSQFMITVDELSIGTGITEDRLTSFEEGKLEPAGDEILILADFYKCDYNFFISNEMKTSFEETELLFRRYGSELSKIDRWAIQEVLFLAGCEKELNDMLGISVTSEFKYSPKGSYYKGQGIEAAYKLRDYLSYKANEFNLNVYEEFRKIGLLIFRRQLENSSISGVCIYHPQAGKCLLINYNDDIYRQRFSVAHEVGHSIFDYTGKEPIISHTKWDPKDLKEVRANYFASNYLVPKQLLDSIPDNKNWNAEKIVVWANKIRVNAQPLLYSLEGNGYIDSAKVKELLGVKVSIDEKVDPEFSGLNDVSINRKKYLLERGLTLSYVKKCTDAFNRNYISLRRMAEMMLVDEKELYEISDLFKLGLEYAS
jgi:Zn-dependent peptidase ImmA (M78 family)